MTDNFNLFCLNYACVCVFVCIDKPVIVGLEEGCLIFQLNKQAELPCGKSILGYPLPDYSWKRCHTPFLSDGLCQSEEVVGNEYTLTLTNAHYNDSGTYQCVASNDLGRDSASMCVEVLGEDNTHTYRRMHTYTHTCIHTYTHLIWGFILLTRIFLLVSDGRYGFLSRVRWSDNLQLISHQMEEPPPVTIT